MSDLSAQKRLAADVLDVGQSRVWFDPDAQGEIADAITRDDIRDLVDEGAIRDKEKKGNSRGRARERAQKREYGHRTGPGTRKGKAGARHDSKTNWENTVRAQRGVLQSLRDDGTISRSQYRTAYRKVSGGEFRSVGYLVNFLNNQYDLDIDRDEVTK